MFNSLYLESEKNNKQQNIYILTRFIRKKRQLKNSGPAVDLLKTSKANSVFSKACVQLAVTPLDKNRAL